MEMSQAAMLDALALQVAWGADEALDAAPVDRRRAPAAPLATAPASPIAGPQGSAARAQVEAETAQTLEAFYRSVACSTACGLAATATRIALADGNPEAGLVLVGETPGDEEDREGRPFVGPAGRLLDRMLGSVGLGRRDALLTNLVPWRPPGGRAPTDVEVAACIPFLWRHLTLLRPRVVVSLGVLPARVLTGKAETLRRVRGRWHEVSVPGLPTPIPVLPMVHPATLIRTPDAKKAAWADLLTLKRWLLANS